MPARLDELAQLATKSFRRKTPRIFPACIGRNASRLCLKGAYRGDDGRARLLGEEHARWPCVVEPANGFLGAPLVVGDNGRAVRLCLHRRDPEVLFGRKYACARGRQPAIAFYVWKAAE